MQNNQKIILSVVVAAVLAAVVLKRRPTPAPHTTIASSAPDASVSASASAAPQPPAARMKFSFDCSGIAPEVADTCSERPAAARALLELSDWYRVSALPCSSVPDKDLLERAVSALRAVAALPAKELSPLLRAQLQSTALKLLSCATGAEPAERAKAARAQAKALLRKLTLSATELSALPESGATLNGWLGDTNALARGAASTAFHSQGDGFSRAYTQAQGADLVANIGRLVLVDAEGKPVLTDTVDRVLVRRVKDGAVQVCLAELDAGCGALGRLRPLASDVGARFVQGTPTLKTIGCGGCHFNNHLHGGPYGPELGVALPENKAALVRAQLAPILAP